MENYILPDNLSLENFNKLGATLCLYEDFKTKDLQKKLHEVALEVGCSMKNDNFWCLHEDCLESTETFENGRGKRKQNVVGKIFRRGISVKQSSQASKITDISQL